MKVLFIGKKMILAMGLLVIVSVGFFATPKVQEIVVSSTKRDLPIYNVQTETKVVSLSFDAAWGNEDTQQLIDILGEHNIKATFFVVGEWVDKYPESVLALFEAGHEIQNHSDTHPHMTTLEYNKMVAEMNNCSDKIEAITGVRPTLFRPPYGDYDDKLVATLREQGYYCIQWDVDSLDWKNPTPAEITSRVLEKSSNGSIILFHNAAINTPSALPNIISGFIEKGYSFSKISDLIYTDDYTIDHKGTQIKDS